MSARNDELLDIIDDEEGTASLNAMAQLVEPEEEPWYLLVVDDEPDIHRVTRFVLDGFEFQNKGLQIWGAYSGAEARKLLGEEGLKPAVILLDVVMETDDAGLRLVKYIREELGNRQTRIILRTGQPGAAPEKQVVVDYDINDYKAKSELTAQKLVTALIASLRSYQDILTIERGRAGLQQVIEASASLFEMRSMEDFLSGVLTQINALFGLGTSAMLCTQGSNVAIVPDEMIRLRSGSGRYAGVGGTIDNLEDPELVSAIDWSFRHRASRFTEGRSAVFFAARGDMSVVIYLEGPPHIDPLMRQLVDLFCSKASIAFDNILLFEQLRFAQESTVFALAKLAEFKDPTTGGHLRRVEELSNLIAGEMFARKLYPGEVDEILLEKIGLASILHDVGKVGVPDEVLVKPGKLDEDEWALMQRHAVMGNLILAEAAKRVRGRSFLSIGAEIALNHHERWDGDGYPGKHAGTAIPIAARIVAVADVYDALVSVRPYKPAWPREDAVAWIRNHAGTHFDPVVVDAFLAVVDRVPLPPVA